METELFAPFDVNSSENIQLLKTQSQKMLTQLKEKSVQKTKDRPYLFLKNNSGTYGLGITTIDCAEDLDSFTYKNRKRMKATKGNSGIKELILQEGIPTVLGDEENVEPVIYMVGAELTGGFLRGHSKKRFSGEFKQPGVCL